MTVTENVPILNREVALVTGSTSGIGKAIAHRLCERGMHVILHSATSVDAGVALAHTLGHAHYIQADLALEAERTRLITQTIEATGRLDLVINNAAASGLIPHDDLMAATPEIWRFLHEVNVIAPFHLVALAEPYLRASAERNASASIINISSHAGVRPKGASIPYAATKAALNHVTRLLAKTLAPEIRVNAIAPGLVHTPLTKQWSEAQELWNTHAPMQRAATPEDIVQVVTLILESRYLTGEILLADGGMNLT